MYLLLQITEQTLCGMNKAVNKAGDIIPVSVMQKTFQSLLHLWTFWIFAFIISAKYLHSIIDDFLEIEDILDNIFTMYTYFQDYSPSKTM